MSLLLLFQGDATQVNGTLSITEANDTVAGAGALRISGVLARIEAGDTVASTATLAITGILSRTEAADTLAASGVLPIIGTALIAEANDTLIAPGTVLVQGTLARTEANDTLSAAGALAVTGTLAVVEQDDTPFGAGAVAITGTLSATEAEDILVASGLMPVFYPRRGGTDERQEFEHRQREWQESLRPIIDRSFRIANGEIDRVTFEEIPPPDYSPINAALAAQELALDRQRIDQFVAARRQNQEDEAMAILLLAA